MAGFASGSGHLPCQPVPVGCGEPDSDSDFGSGSSQSVKVKKVKKVKAKRLAKLTKSQLGQIQNAPPPTQFRAIEQYFKQRLAQPDYALAFGRHCIPQINLPHHQPRLVEWSTPNKTTSIIAHIHSIPVSSTSEHLATVCRKCPPRAFSTICTFPKHYPGLVYLPSYLCEHQQANLVTDCLTNGLRKPNLTNLDAHWQVPSEAGIYQLYQDWLQSSQSMPNQQLQDSQPNQQDDQSRFILQPRLAPDSNPPEVNQNNPGPTRRQRVDFEPITAENFLIARNEKTKEDPVLKGAKPIHIRDVWMGGKLRWCTIGWQYHWTTKTYHFDREPTPISDLVKSTCTDLINRVIPWSVIEGEISGDQKAGLVGSEQEGWKKLYKAEAGVINFYQYRDALTAHIDQSEVSTDSPLVSLSIGQACIFLISQTRDQEPLALKLESGDALIMAGQTRRYFHGVPRIIENSLPQNWLSDKLDFDDNLCFNHLDWLEWFQIGGRINLNVRQVF